MRRTCLVLACFALAVAAGAKEATFAGTGTWNTTACLTDGLPLLFADDAMLAAQTNVQRIVHPAACDGEPVLRPLFPWEGGRIYVYGSVWPQPDGGWRLWYGAGDAVLVADSPDGIKWNRNALGSKNIVTSGFHSPSVLLDRFDKDATRRYKLVGSQFHSKADGKPDLERTGYYVAMSPDGVHWTPPRQIIKGWWDTVTMAQNPHTGEILVYHKRQTPWRGWPSCRIVFLTKSMDFERWTEPQLVFAPDEEDDGWIDNPDQHMEIYNMSVLPHAGGYLGFPTMFRVTGTIKNPARGQSGTDGVVDVQLATSSDGETWRRTPGRRTIVARGAEGTFDGGTILGISNSAITTGDVSMMYYTALTTSHGGKMPEKRISVGRAVWRRWGWVSLAACRKGSFTTRPLTLDTDRLVLNARPLADGGNVRLSILDADGRPMPGLDAKSSIPLVSDETRHVAAWCGGRRPPVGVPVMVRLDLDRSEAYSISCERQRRNERIDR